MSTQRSTEFKVKSVSAFQMFSITNLKSAGYGSRLGRHLGLITNEQTRKLSRCPGSKIYFVPTVTNLIQEIICIFFNNNTVKPARIEIHFNIINKVSNRFYFLNEKRGKFCFEVSFFNSGFSLKQHTQHDYKGYYHFIIRGLWQNSKADNSSFLSLTSKDSKTDEAWSALIWVYPSSRRPLGLAHRLTGRHLAPDCRVVFSASSGCP